MNLIKLITYKDGTPVEIIEKIRLIRNTNNTRII